MSHYFNAIGMNIKYSYSTAECMNKPNKSSKICLAPTVATACAIIRLVQMLTPSMIFQVFLLLHCASCAGEISNFHMLWSPADSFTHFLDLSLSTSLHFLFRVTLRKSAYFLRLFSTPWSSHERFSSSFVRNWGKSSQQLEPPFIYIYRSMSSQSHALASM